METIREQIKERIMELNKEKEVELIYFLEQFFPQDLGITVKIHDGKIHLTTPKYMPLVYSAEDKFRKGIEIDYCTECKDLNVIFIYGFGKANKNRKLCEKCTKKHFEDRK